jgi:hypothetical protein
MIAGGRTTFTSQVSVALGSIVENNSGQVAFPDSLPHIFTGVPAICAVIVAVPSLIAVHVVSTHVMTDGSPDEIEKVGCVPQRTNEYVSAPIV